MWKHSVEYSVNENGKYLEFIIILSEHALQVPQAPAQTQPVQPAQTQPVQAQTQPADQTPQPAAQVQPQAQTPTA